MHLLTPLWKSYPCFLTNWALTLFLLYCLGLLPTTWNFTLLVFLCRASLGGFYLTYLHPRKIHVDALGVILKGFPLQVFDVLFHQLPLVFFLLTFSPGTRIVLLPFLVLMMVYLFFFNPTKVYRITWLEIEILSIFLACFLV